MESTASIDLVTVQIRQIFQDVVFVAMCGVVSVVGFAANITNIAVFIKQGFKDKINISLFGLAVADLACVTTILWSCICIHPLMISSGQPFASIDFLYLTGSWPHVCFNRITSCITAFITFERCLCVAIPLKVKQIITASRTKATIVSTFIAMFVIFSPTYFVNKLQWGHHPIFNRTMLTLVFTEHRTLVETITFLIHSVIVSTISILFVIVCTSILVIQLNLKSKWRQATAAQTKGTDISSKDKKAVKMVIIIAIIFVICYLPSAVVFFTMAYYPDFNFGGKFENCFVCVWSVGLLLETLSSSTNIFIYFGLSVKFRITLVQLFSVC